MAYTPTLRALGAWWPVTTVLVAMAGYRIVNVPVAAQTGARPVDVLIAFDQTPGPPEEALVRAAGANVRFRFHLVPAVAASVPAQAIQGLLNNPRITAVEPDIRIDAFDAEMDRSWGVRRIGGAPVHAANVLGAGVGVAVLDTGIDYTHPDLAVNYAGGHDFVNGDDDPWDDNGHGTHVAGTIAARDDDAGVVGVAPQATLFALKVLDASGQGLVSHVVAALEWAVDHGVSVTNHSYGTSIDPGTIVQQAFDNAEAAGVLNVAAAGNSGNCDGTGDNVTFPARFASVIAVAATDSLDVSPCFSSTGPKVELSAPGVGVNSTVPGGGHQEASGTSMASPHVAGTAAVLFSQGELPDSNGNGRINDEIRQRLIATAQDLGLPGPDTWYGYGLVDARAAADVALPLDPVVTVGLTMNKGLYLAGVDPAAQLTLVVKDENGANIPGLAASRFVTSVDGGVRTVTFAPTVDGRYTGSLALSGLATGSHSIGVVVRDARDVAGAGSGSFQLALAVQATSVRYAMSGPAGKRTLSITVTVVDPASGAAIRGASVTIHVNKDGAPFYGLTATTNASGIASFTIKNAPPACYTTRVSGIAIVGRIWDQTTPLNQSCF